MKKLVFEEIMILSFQEKKAIRLEFNPQKTIIRGNNQVGKSSLIKSIYYTLGATPAVLNNNWLKSEPITYLKMSLDGEAFSVLRYDKKRYVTVDENKNVTAQTYKTLSSFLNLRLDFNILLTNRKGEAEVPPPTYLFLPFYIDQDKGWSDNWNSFANLSQFSNWKKALIDYHSGIKGNRYYSAKSEFDSIKIEIDNTKDEIKALSKILRNVNDKLQNEDFNVSIDDFSKEISQLLSECESLKIEQNKLRVTLNDFYNQKSQITSRISIVHKSINETKLDYKYALNYDSDDIDCPMCGAHYENNFSERFSIAQDEEQLQDLLDELQIELAKVNDEIIKYDKSFIEKKANFEKIQELLNEKQSEVKLIDIIENEGKKRVKEIFELERNEIYSKMGKSQSQHARLEEQLKSINKDGEDTKQKIMTLYRSKLTSFIKELNLKKDKTSKTIFERMDAKINEQGSNLPRALLAYYFAFLEVMDKYSTSTFCPIVIDSPNQQEQDKENLIAIMDFINNNQPSQSQLILSIVDDPQNVFSDSTSMLEDTKYSLLKSQYFEEVYDELKPIIDKGIFGDELFAF
jgi:uncharacterized protein (UPF0212 family)